MKNRYLLIAIGAALLMALLVAMNYFLAAPKIIETSPNNEATGVDLETPKIIIKLNYVSGKLGANNISIKPELDYSLKVNGKEVVITPTELLENSSLYTITLTTKSRLGTEKTLLTTFKTEYLEFVDLPEEIQQREIEETDACEDGLLQESSCPS